MTFCTGSDGEQFIIEMLKDGFSVTQTAKLTKLPAEEIERLKSTIV
jgi:hypothetical protein